MRTVKPTPHRPQHPTSISGFRLTDLPCRSQRGIRQALLPSLVCLLSSAQLQAAVFDDGGTHTINNGDYQDEGISVRNGTTLLIESGALFGDIQSLSGMIEILGNSSVTIFGGRFGGDGVLSGSILVTLNSRLTIEGGVFGGGGNSSGLIMPTAGAVVTVNGGTFGGQGERSGGWIIDTSSTVTINDGSFRAPRGQDPGFIEVHSSVIIRGGSFQGAGTDGPPLINTRFTGSAIIAGGTFIDPVSGAALVRCWEESVLTFFGSAFDASAFAPDTGGRLGVAFCSGNLQRLAIEKKQETVTVNLDLVECDADSDGVPDDLDTCPNSADINRTIRIAGCDTGVPNVVFESGCTISDKIQELANAAKNHGQFVSGIAALKNQLRKAGNITDAQAKAIQNCAAKAAIP